MIERSFWTRSQSDDLIGQLRPALVVGEQRADAIGEERRDRELAAGIDRNLRRVVGGAGGDHLVLVDALEAEDQPGEEERVARRQRLDEAFLDLAEDAACPPGEARAAVARDADVEERRLDDGADVQAVLLGDARVGDAPEAVGALAGSWRSARRC